MGTTEEKLNKAPNVERINVKMEENDQLTLQNMLYKIQLEQERVKNAKLHLQNAELCEKLVTQELKIWEGTYKLRLSENKYEIQRMSIDADSGEVVMDVLPKKNIDGSRPNKIISKTNGKPNGKVKAEQSAGV